MWKVFETQDGSSSVLSEAFGVSYHSRYGAVQESKHVFIESGLYFKAISQKQLSILEIGFGTGLNVLLTYQEAQRLGLSIDYVTIENFPISKEVVEKLNYPSLLQMQGANGIFEKIHEVDWEATHALSPSFAFEKMRMPFEDIDFAAKFDLIFFDAFAPDVQPQLWELPLTQQMYQALKPGGVLVTYCAKGSYKRALKFAGFIVEALKGPPGKREMTRALKPNSL